MLKQLKKAARRGGGVRKKLRAVVFFSTVSQLQNPPVSAVCNCPQLTRAELGLTTMVGWLGYCYVLGIKLIILENPED